MKRLFKWLLFLSIAFAISIALVIYNPGMIKGPLERYLSDIADYPISLNGDVDIELGKLTTLTVKNIHISGPDWSVHPDLIAANHLKLSVTTSSLFKDVVILELLEMDSFQLNLETDAEGKGNWISASKPASTAKKEGSSPVVIFKNIEVSNSSLRFRNGKTEKDNVFSIDTISHHQDSHGMLQTTLEGELNDRLVEFTSSIGPYENLLNTRNISYTAEGFLGELKIRSNGIIDDLLKPKRPTFSIDIQGPDVDEITAMLGVDDLGSGEFNLRARGAEVGDLYEADINGKVGDISINASVQTSDLSQFSDTSKFNELDLELAITGPSVGAFTRVFGLEDWPDKPFSLKGGAKRIGSTMNVRSLTLNIGGTQLLLDALLTNFPSFDASRVKLAITGDDIVQFRELLGIPGMATGPFAINGKLDVTQEEVELIEVNMKTSLGKAILSGTLGDGPDFIGTKLHLHLDGNNAHSLMAVMGIDALPEQPFNLNTRFELLENSLRVERGVLVTIEDDRLEMGGLITFNPGIEGSVLDLKVSGNDLAQMLQHVVDTTDIPGRPYDLSGQISVLAQGLKLENTSLDFMGVNLRADGSVLFADQLVGSGIDFQVSGSDFSALGDIEVIGDSLDVFVPGQPYYANGNVTVDANGWQLGNVSGQLGETELGFNSLISNQPGLAGTNVSFSLQGPDLNLLLLDRNDVPLSTGAFKSSGQVLLNKDSLKIDKLSFDTDNAHARVDLDLGWPLTKTIDVGFDVSIQGADIRLLLPRIESFEPDRAAFELKAIGEKRGDRVSVEQFSAHIGETHILLKGEIGDDPANENADVAFSVVSKDISRLGLLKGERLPAMVFDIKSDLEVNANQIGFHNLVASLGESQLEGSLDILLDGPKPQIKIASKSSHIDIRPYFEEDEAEDVNDETTDPPKRQERLIPATPLPLDFLTAADVEINLNIDTLQHAKDSIRNVVLNARVNAGSLVVSEYSFEAPKGNLRTSFSILPTGSGQADVKMELAAEQLVLNLSGQSEENLHLVPSLNLDLHVSGKGSNLQEVAGSLNGSFYLESGGGLVEGVNLSILDTFILDEIFSLIMPKSSASENLNLTCAATIMNIEGGVIHTDPALAFTTDQIALIAKGTLDLETEKMHFNFNATPTNALKISAGELFNPYILVGGTLSKPEVGIDPAKAILHGGAAIGTAGFSILAKGLIDRAGNAMPMCEKMQKTIREREQSVP